MLRELKGEQGFVEVGGLELTKKKKNGSDQKATPFLSAILCPKSSHSFSTWCRFYKTYFRCIRCKL